MQTNFNGSKVKFVPSLLLLVLASFVLLSCVREKSRLSESSRNDAVEAALSDLHLPLLKSFGIEPKVSLCNLGVPLPTGKTQNVVSLKCLQVEFAPNHPLGLQKLLPLYAHLSASCVSFSQPGQSYFLSDLFSPAVQAVLNTELQFDPEAIKLSSTETLFSVLLSDGRRMRFISYADSQLGSTLLSNQGFERVNMVSLLAHSAGAGGRERNSGFAVGDLVVFHRDNRVAHTAIWLDHDLYLEALVFARSVLFRFASWSQVANELALREHDQSSNLAISVLRRMEAWPEIASRLENLGSQNLVAEAVLESDFRGRGRVVSASGLTVRLRLKGPAGGDAYPQDSRQ